MCIEAKNRLRSCSHFLFSFSAEIIARDAREKTRRESERACMRAYVLERVRRMRSPAEENSSRLSQLSARVSPRRSYQVTLIKYRAQEMFLNMFQARGGACRDDCQRRASILVSQSCAAPEHKYLLHCRAIVHTRVIRLAGEYWRTHNDV